MKTCSGWTHGPCRSLACLSVVLFLGLLCSCQYLSNYRPGTFVFTYYKSPCVRLFSSDGFVSVRRAIRLPYSVPIEATISLSLLSHTNQLYRGDKTHEHPPASPITAVPRPGLIPLRLFQQQVEAGYQVEHVVGGTNERQPIVQPVGNAPAKPAPRKRPPDLKLHLICDWWVRHPRACAAYVHAAKGARRGRYGDESESLERIASETTG